MDRIISLNFTTIDLYTRLVLYCPQNDANLKLQYFTIQRDNNAEDGREIYIFYRNDKWRFASGTRFRTNSNKNWINLDSSGNK